MLVLALAAAVVAITLARDPRNWFWLTGPNANKKTHSHDVDTAVPSDTDSPLKPDEFRIVRSPTEPSSGDEDAYTNASQNRDTDRLKSEPLPGSLPPESANEKKTAEQKLADHKIGEASSLKFPKEWFVGVTDNTVGILSKEAPLYYSILDRLRAASLREIEAACEAKDVSFAELFNDSDLFRGRFITLSGELRRWEKLPPPADRPDAPPVFEGWFFTDDGGPKHPYHILSVESPAGLPEGDEIRIPVKLTGCFLKKSSYRTLRGMNSAPILLVKQPRILARQDDGRNGVESQNYAAVLAGAVLLMGIGFAGILWWYSALETSARKPIFSGLHGTAFAAQPSTVGPPTESSADGDALNVRDALQQIANEHTAAMNSGSETQPPV